jgi:hypothetical protein
MTASPNRLIAVVVGALYLAVGLIGFPVASGFGFTATEGGLLLGFIQVNILQSVVHVLIGAALLLCSLRTVRVAKSGNAVIGTFSLVFGLVGLFVSGSESNILALNGAGNALHFATAIVLLAASLGAEKGDSQPKRAQPPTPTR